MSEFSEQPELETSPSHPMLEKLQTFLDSREQDVLSRWGNREWKIDQELTRKETFKRALLFLGASTLAVGLNELMGIAEFLPITETLVKLATAGTAVGAMGNVFRPAFQKIELSFFRERRRSRQT